MQIPVCAFTPEHSEGIFKVLHVEHVRTNSRAEQAKARAHFTQSILMSLRNAHIPLTFCSSNDKLVDRIICMNVLDTCSAPAHKQFSCVCAAHVWVSGCTSWQTDGVDDDGDDSVYSILKSTCAEHITYTKAYIDCMYLLSPPCTKCRCLNADYAEFANMRQVRRCERNTRSKWFLQCS